METFVLYDASQPNADGSRLTLEALSLERFRHNPVMLYMHGRGLSFGDSTGSEVIGRWDNLRTEGNKLLAEAVFDEEDALGKKIASKVRQGFLNAASVGIQVHRYAEQGTRITAGTLLEASIVDIPSNEGALRQAPQAPTQNLVYYSYPTERAPSQQNTVLQSKNTQSMTDHAFKQSLCKPLGLAAEATDSEILLALTTLQKEKEQAETAQAQLAKELASEKSQQDAAQLQQALTLGAITAEEAETYKTLFASDRTATQALLATALKKRETAAQQAAAAQEKIAQAVAGSPAPQAASQAVPAQKELSEKELKTLRVKDPAAYEKYINAIANEDTGLVSCGESSL